MKKAAALIISLLMFCTVSCADGDFESRIIVFKGDCKVIVLTARVENFIEAAQKEKIHLSNRINTLINGKKASLFKCSFNS